MVPPSLDALRTCLFCLMVNPPLAKAMANTRESKQKHELYSCWVCSNNVSTGASVGCEDCDAWAHAKCVNLPDTFIGHMNKGNRIRINAHCDSCMSNKNQNGVIDEGNKGIKTDHGNTKRPHS